MSHVDEGTLHAYLDGELSAADGAELERHISVCVPCRNAMNEARGFLAESDQMIRALDVVTPAAAVAPAPRRPFVRLTTLAWAASILVAVGLGYSLRTAPLPGVAAPAATNEGTTPSDAPSAPTPVAVAPVPSPAHGGGREEAPARQIPSARAPDQKVAVDARDAAADEIAPANAGTGATSLAAPQGAVAQAAPAPSMSGETRAAQPSRVAMVDGTPVDTTLPRHLFGPAHTPAPRRITMDEAVTHLGGTIRLIDGLAPQRVELLAGVDVPGADPSREVVRIYYEEPDLGLVTLDQQRPGPSFAFSQPRADAPPESVSVRNGPELSGARLAAPTRSALASLTWRSDGAWLSLTSRLSKDQMASLQARVK